MEHNFIMNHFLDKLDEIGKFNTNKGKNNFFIPVLAYDFYFSIVKALKCNK